MPVAVALSAFLRFDNALPITLDALDVRFNTTWPVRSDVFACIVFGLRPSLGRTIWWHHEVPLWRAIVVLNCRLDTRVYASLCKICFTLNS